MNYKIHVIPNKSQRYDTVGDYWMKNAQNIEMRISDFTEVTSSNGNLVNMEEVRNAEDYEFLVMIHELVEAFLCRRNGIKYEDIDKFDFAQVLLGKVNEYGDMPEAPYHTEHIQATLVEQYLAQILSVSWEEYSAAIDKFSKKNEQESANI